MNIVDIAAGSDDFNLLVRALTTVDLADTVRGLDDITVFAPTDAAFTQLATDLGFDGDTTDEDAVFGFIVQALTDLGDGDPAPLLTNILLYHVSAGAKTQAEIQAASSVATLLDGSDITPDGDELVDGEPDIQDAMIVTPDIAADNGTIQAIDRVLLPIDIPGNTPPTITGIVAASGDGFDSDGTDFDMLLSAVIAAGLADTLDAENADFTVFAPTDAAFVRAAQTLGYQGSDEEGAFNFIVQALTLLSQGKDPIPLLTSILTYHVVPGTRDSGDVTTSESLPTVQGATIGVNGLQLVDQDPDLPDPMIETPDIPASNGIVHTIDNLLFPIDILPSDGSDDVDFLFGNESAEVFHLGADNDYVNAGGGNDTIAGDAGNDVIVGGDGHDRAVVTGNHNDYGLSISAHGVTVQNKASQTAETDFLVETELLQFGDGFSFHDSDGLNLGILSGAAHLSSDQLVSLVELYIAYFNRAPDSLGVLFWGNALKNGVDIRDIAELFFDQPEARAKMPPDSDIPAFVDMAYAHLLERTADDAGRAFWIEQLEQANISRAEFMLEIIEGARANPESIEDVRTIEDKTDIGVAYGVIAGLIDADDAAIVIDAYDRDNAASSLQTAQDLIAQFLDDANGADGSNDLTIQLMGVIDDPFML